MKKPGFFWSSLFQLNNLLKDNLHFFGSEVSRKSCREKVFGLDFTSSSFLVCEKFNAPFFLVLIGQSGDELTENPSAVQLDEAGLLVRELVQLFDCDILTVDLMMLPTKRKIQEISLTHLSPALHFI